MPFTIIIPGINKNCFFYSASISLMACKIDNMDPTEMVSHPHMITIQNTQQQNNQKQRKDNNLQNAYDRERDAFLLPTHG